MVKNIIIHHDKMPYSQHLKKNPCLSLFLCDGMLFIISVPRHSSRSVYREQTSEVYKSATFPASTRGLKLPLRLKPTGIVSSQLQQNLPPTTSLLPSFNVTEKSPCG